MLAASVPSESLPGHVCETLVKNSQTKDTTAKHPVLQFDQLKYHFENMTPIEAIKTSETFSKTHNSNRPYTSKLKSH